MPRIWSMLIGCLLMGFADAQSSSDTIPFGGNAWRHKTGFPTVVGDSSGGYIDNHGIGGWTDNRVFFEVWLRISRPGDLRVWVAAKMPDGRSRIDVIGGTDRRKVTLDVKGDTLIYYDAGNFHFGDTGYQHFTIRGIERSGSVFAELPAIVVQGPPIESGAAFVPNNEGNFFHWGRRGPSVHLNYPLAAGFDASWFYNEVTVPPDQDVQGSYFMACGFAHGYFGMQVNSPTERHILFSVWSPFETDNPAAIPDSQRIRIVAKGEGVHTGEFGNEGAGGQSYLNFPWKAGQTYRFLLHAQPEDHGHMVYSAWWYAPEEGHWRLIASFSRPQISDRLTGLYSFLENFEPEEGDHRRYVAFNHGWAGDDAGHWLSLHRARFTVDNTGRKGYRLDYGGGVRDGGVWDGGARDGGFYLENGGFFDKYTPAGIWLDRGADVDGRGPGIALPK